MKSYFSRFLHHTLSHLGGKPDTSSSLSYSDRKPDTHSYLSYSGLTRISRWNKFATLFDLNHRVKPDGDSVCAGRSMVEMLGVLAIIGVLSVGAIAGYSKAMMKYKMNQAADGYNHLIATVIEKIAQDSSVFEGDSVGTLWYTSIFAKAGWLPDYFKPRKDTATNPDAVNFVQDKFGNDVWIFKKKDKHLGIGVRTNRQKELCITLFNLGKEWKDDLNACDVENFNGSVIHGEFFGDKSCNSGVKCLANITVDDIDTACSPCETQNCRFYFMTNAMP